MNYDKFRFEIQEVLKRYPGIKSVTIKAVAQYDIFVESDGEQKVADQIIEQKQPEIGETKKTTSDIPPIPETNDFSFLETDLSREEFK